jgi:hypothetical protein
MKTRNHSDESAAVVEPIRKGTGDHSEELLTPVKAIRKDTGSQSGESTTAGSGRRLALNPRSHRLG